MYGNGCTQLVLDAFFDTTVVLFKTRFDEIRMLECKIITLTDKFKE